MSPRETAEFLALAAIWGASFLFMRIAAPELGPVPLMLVRCAIGALTLLLVLLHRGELEALLANAGRACLVGVVNSAVPFVLLGYATLVLSAGVTSILNSLAPLWTALIAFAWLGERLTRAGLLGLVLGVVGVTILVGGSGVAAEEGGGHAARLWPFAAGIAATAFYGVGANLARRLLAGVPPLATATGSQLGASAALLVPGVLLWPESGSGLSASGVPAAGAVAAGAPAAIVSVSGSVVSGSVASAAAAAGAGIWLAALALGVLCTGFAYLLFFRLIASVGATRTIAVTFVIPVFGVGWGAVFLGERIDAATVLGAVVIVLGTALATGVLGGGRSAARRIAVSPGEAGRSEDA